MGDVLAGWGKEEGFGSVGKGADKGLWSDDIGAEVDTGNFAQEIHAEVDGSGFRYDARRADENDIEGRVPSEMFSSRKPNVPTKRAGEGGNAGPEIHSRRGFAVGTIGYESL